jgi:hypothetical protein
MSSMVNLFLVLYRKLQQKRVTETMYLAFGVILFLLAAVYSIILQAGKRNVQVVRKNCLRQPDEDAEF